MAWQQRWPLQIWSSWDGSSHLTMCHHSLRGKWTPALNISVSVDLHYLYVYIYWAEISGDMQVFALVLQCGHRIDDLEPTPQKYAWWSNSLSHLKMSNFCKALSQPLRNKESEQLLSLEKMLPHLTSRFRSMLCILTDRDLTGILLWEVITFCVSICSVLYGGMHGRCCHHIFRMGAHCAGLPAAQMWKLRAKSIRFRGRKDARSRKHGDKFF